MSIDRRKTKKVVKTVGIVTSIIFIVMMLVAKCKKKDSIYENEPDEKNHLYGKKVVFVQNDDDVENADGLKGHLEAVGDSQYKQNFYEKYIKRIIDVLLSFFGLVILSPLYTIIAIAIKIDDPGPVLFTQKRVGQNKQYFKLHKFRSMKMNTPHEVPTHMLDDPDKYITRVGKFLRKHSLDELPQIWDIFIGNMSIVGPRPALWNQDVLTSERDKYYANDVKPGLTGLAQINGRDELEIPDKAKLDGEYVKNLGLLMDAKVFLKSFSVFGNDENVVEGGTGSIKEIQTKLPLIATFSDKIDFNEEKKILVAGSGSYIGEKFKEYMGQYDNYQVSSVSTMNDDWKNLDFSSFDVVYDVAGIAHVKETNENRSLYYKVNRDLAVEIAKKAKSEGVRQFIYLSSMSVYGLTVGRIDKETLLNPVSAYGKSKLEAEELLWELNDDSFTVSIIRPPMVYGEGCKGNYQLLRKFSLKFAFFPDYNNKRSMLFIDNLSSSVRGIIHNNKSGVYFPQDHEYIKTYDMVKEIAEVNGKRFHKTKLLNLMIKFMAKRVGLLGKVFGTLTYNRLMNVPDSWLAITDLKEAIRLSEGQYLKKDEEQPLVTILTVAYNSENTIAKTIEAVLNQSYQNIEYIIIDGASTDRTVEIAKQYQDRFDSLKGKSLTVISEPDKGMYDALNKGAKMARGILIGQTNADDFYELDAVENMVKLFNETHYDVAWGSIRVLKPSGNTIKHAKIGKLWTTSGWCHPAMFSRREVLLENPYICESMYDDFDFITTIHQKNEKIVTTDKVISNFSFGGMSTKKDLAEVRKRVNILYKVYRRHNMSQLYYLQRWVVELAKYILG